MHQRKQAAGTDSSRLTEDERDFVTAYVDGDAALPELFSTGFRRDLHLAREIVRQRRERSQEPVPRAGAFAGRPQ